MKIVIHNSEHLIIEFRVDNQENSHALFKPFIQQKPIKNIFAIIKDLNLHDIKLQNKDIKDTIEINSTITSARVLWKECIKEGYMDSDALLMSATEYQNN